MVQYARSIGVSVGKDCRICNNVVFGSEPYLVHLGEHVELASGVRFATHDGGVWVFRKENPEWDLVAPIAIGDNVYIGIRAIILPGVTIGANSVIGAGAVVTRSIPENSVAVGVPAKVIKSTHEYHVKCAENAIPTKGMSREEKRRFLEQLYGRT